MADKEEVTRQQTVFEDVFRRADKNDDGAISWDEFRNFFDDSVSTTEELKKLFSEIDTHNTNNLDVGELCEFFKNHLGPFADIFKSLDELSRSVTCALVQCRQKYSTSSVTEQFSTRFLLREVLRQFGFQQHHLELASDKIDEEENDKRPVSFKEAQNEEKYSGRGGRMLRKMQSYQQQTSFSPPYSSLEVEIDRLADLIDRLDSKVRLDIIEEEIVDEGSDEPIELVCRKFIAEAAALSNLKSFLRSYLLEVKKNESCLGTSVRIHIKDGCFTLYEIWKTKAALNSHLVSDSFRTFQRQLIDCLVQPEDFSKMSLPASWWCKQ